MEGGKPQKYLTKFEYTLQCNNPEPSNLSLTVPVYPGVQKAGPVQREVRALDLETARLTLLVYKLPNLR